MTVLTIVFADLTGSTGLFEALGNSRATDMISRSTHWIGKLIQARGGRVIKYLGDGVLASFADNQAAVAGMVEMQRLHKDRAVAGAQTGGMQIKVGLARGDVIEQDDDCFGDAVNLASRLSDLAGPEQIFASASVITALFNEADFNYRNLGPLEVRGRAEPVTVYRVEWLRETTSEIMTMQAGIEVMSAHSPHRPSSIELSAGEQKLSFDAADMPVFLGRGNDAHFPVLDPRVSRLHARLDRRGELFVLSDISSYGTWIRFDGSTSVVALRRQECVLLDKGEMALGAPFEDPSAARVSFRFAIP